MKTHIMNLHNDPFMRIVSGIKTMEYRLFDEKRKNIRLGDHIEFLNRDSGATCIVQVTGILQYPTFDELFMDIQPHLRDESIGLYYTAEDQKSYGVVGFKITIIV